MKAYPIIKKPAFLVEKTKTIGYKEKSKERKREVVVVGNTTQVARDKEDFE